MYLPLLISLVLISGTFGFQDKIPGIVDGLWDTYLGKQAGGVVNASSWVEYLNKYADFPPIDSELLELSEGEFIDGWVEDFNISVAEARGYFGILNLDTSTPILLTERDADRLVAYADDSWDQTNDHAEFYKHIPGLFRPIPWAIMFDDYDIRGFGRLDYEEFLDMAADWDVDDDGEVSLEDFQDFWKEGLYGNSTTGAKSHAGLDFDGDGVITITDIDELFDILDRDGRGEVYFDEFLEIDFIINGWAS